MLVLVDKNMPKVCLLLVLIVRKTKSLLCLVSILQLKSVCYVEGKMVSPSLLSK